MPITRSLLELKPGCKGVTLVGMIFFTPVIKELQKRHIRLTPQREAVLLVLYREKDEHLTSYELFEKAKKIYPELGLATVYRTLELFQEVGFAQRGSV